MKYSDILRNQHFNNLATVIRVPFRSREWRKEHNEVPFWTLWDGLNAVKTEEAFATNRTEFVSRFCNFLTTLVEADPRLKYSDDDLCWFVSAIDSEHALVIASLLLAWASAPDEMLTPVEVAGMTGTHQSGWRNKAAAGAIPGAEKRGKQWLLPRSVLRAQGVLS